MGRYDNKRKQEEQSTWNSAGELTSYVVTVVMRDGHKYKRIRQGQSAYAVMKDIEVKLSQWSRRKEVSGFYVDPVSKDGTNIS